MEFNATQVNILLISVELIELMSPLCVADIKCGMQKMASWAMSV